MTGRITGIGGLFFRAKDPEALAAWYKTHLGIDANGPWPQEAGESVLGLFGAASDYWPEDRAFMFNIRVAGLDALIERLEAEGISVRREADWDIPEIGRFARIHDPEGTPIELWEPVEGGGA